MTPVDAHTHVASPDASTYPLLPPGLGRDWFSDGSAGVDHLLAALDRAGVARAVVVQAVGAHGFDNRYAADAVASHLDRLRVVVAVDMEADDPAAALWSFAGAPGLRGVRLFGVRGALDWLVDGRAGSVWAVAADLGLTVVPTLYADALEALRPLVTAFPDVPVALDHCGFPDLGGGPPFPGMADVLALADLPAVHLKVTTHVLADVPDAADLVDHLAAAYGADRLCWGSDFPQSAHHDYPGMVALAEHAARRLDPAARATFLGGTAHRLFF